MHTNIHPSLRQHPDIEIAEDILKKCVHCGFCTATCPTYQLLNDERDGPRGRIYLIKQLLETGQVTAKTRTHLDRCLTCRSCETTCPSGVRYGRLADIGRELVESKTERSSGQKLARWAIRKLLPHRNRIGPLLRLGQLTKPLLPTALAAKVPARQQYSPWPSNSHPRVMLAMAGCVQGSATPNTNAATARVLDKLGITLVEIPRAGCCGAVNYHLQAHADGLDDMRRNIDAWWPAIEAGAEALVMTASGCGAMVKEYGELLKKDANYATKAAKVSELTRDISQILLAEDLSKLALNSQQKTAVHCPCTLQHAQGQGGNIETILSRAGLELANTRDAHLCCGSAGTYSLLQPQLSKQLQQSKIAALTIELPEQIVTANVGCQMHLAAASEVPVKHWIELLDPQPPSR